MKIIEKSGYQALPWVRYITQSGGKAARLPDMMGSRRGRGMGLGFDIFLHRGLQNAIGLHPSLPYLYHRATLGLCLPIFKMGAVPGLG